MVYQRIDKGDSKPTNSRHGTNQHNLNSRRSSVNNYAESSHENRTSSKRSKRSNDVNQRSQNQHSLDESNNKRSRSATFVTDAYCSKTNRAIRVSKPAHLINSAATKKDNTAEKSTETFIRMGENGDNIAKLKIETAYMANIITLNKEQITKLQEINMTLDKKYSTEKKFWSQYYTDRLLDAQKRHAELILKVSSDSTTTVIEKNDGKTRLLKEKSSQTKFIQSVQGNSNDYGLVDSLDLGIEEDDQSERYMVIQPENVKLALPLTNEGLQKLRDMKVIQNFRFSK